MGSATAGAGAALAATLASVCCAPVVAPLVVGVLGATGAATAAGLKPYSPYLFGASLAMLAFGFWSIRRPRSCAIGGAPVSKPVSWRIAQAVLYLAVAVWLAAVAFTLFALRSS